MYFQIEQKNFFQYSKKLETNPIREAWFCNSKGGTDEKYVRLFHISKIGLVPRLVFIEKMAI